MEDPPPFSSERHTSYSDPKSSKNKPIKAKNISILVLVVSLPILYVSFLHTPPSTLFKDTTFWFLMSNSIILFIAVDVGTIFAPTHDICEKELGEDLVAYSKPHRVSMEEAPRIIDKSLVVKEKLLDDSTSAMDENKVISFCVEESGTKDTCQEEVASNKELDNALVVKNSGKRKVVKAKSLDPIVHNESRSLVPSHEKPLCRSVTREKTSCCNENKSQDYEMLSDEELNRRVDEFIRRYYSEMRLQLTNESV